MKLNTYAVEANGRWCGGVAIVSAYNEDHAKEVAASKKPTRYNIDYHQAHTVILLPLVYRGKIPTVIHVYETGE